jgi:hypothetical protein
MAHQNFNVKLTKTDNSLKYSNGVFRWNYTCTSKEASENTTGVQRVKPEGFMNPTAYTFLKYNYVYPYGSCLNDPNVTVGASNGQLYEGVVGPPEAGGRFNGHSHFDGCCTGTTAQSDVGLRNMALIAVRNKLKSTEINLGIAFGERNRTARLLGDTATRLARSVRHLRAGRIRRAMDELGISSRRGQPRGSNVTQRWLELQYGWRPLLSDVYGAAAALENRPKGDWRVTAKVTRKQDQEYVKDFTSFDLSTCKASVARSVYARLDALPQNEATISLVSLGVTNPLSVAWELVPFSFVVDWAFPVGTFLSSLDALLGYEDAYYSSSLLVRAEWRDVGRTQQTGNQLIANNFVGTKKMVYLKREVSSSVPIPHPPRLRDPRSLTRMANGLALLAQVFGRGR